MENLFFSNPLINSWNLSKWNIEMWPALCKFLILFPTVKIRLGYNSQFIYRFKIEILRLYFQVLLNSQKDWKLGYLNITLDCTSKIFPLHETVGKLGCLKFPCFHILSDCELCLSHRVYMMGKEVAVDIDYAAIL